MKTALDRFREGRRTQMHAAVAQALRELEQTNSPINMSSVAAAAGVSRQWLYGSPFRAEIESLRLRRPSSRAPGRSTRQAASEASLLAQNEALRERLGQLRKENAALRHDLELVLGNHRSRL